METHLDACVRWLNDPEIHRYLSLQFSLNRALEDAWYAQSANDPNRVIWAITAATQSEAPIGVTSIENIDWIARTGVTGILIGERQYWNQGIATAVMCARAAYAFERLNLMALFTEIFQPNEASRRAAERAGYREYGRKPFARYQDGAYQSAWLGVLAREEWRPASEDGTGGA